jgi:hypothetical protein
MKTFQNTLGFLFIGSILFLLSCNDQLIEKYEANTPVYMSYANLRQAVNDDHVAPISQPGKIYFKDDFIFINEQMKGIHVIDNSNPEKPKIKKFIAIPGNIDLAIKGNILYADSYIDLVALDISNLNDIKETHRIQDIFPYILPECKGGIVTESVDNRKGVVISWKKDVVAKDIQEVSNVYPYYRHYEYADMFYSNAMSGAKGGPSSQGIGVGGSMARFAINGDALYIINMGNVIVFEIDNINKPEKISDNYIGWNIETLFMYGKSLFIGSQTGMHIYDVSNPYALNRLSTYQHVQSCDPVVVEGNNAFVTLRTGNACFGNINELNVVDISDKTNPKLTKIYPMTNPRGLGIDGNILFICDGPDGLKVYDASDVTKIDEHQLAHFKNIRTYDVIPVNGNLFMIGDDGFYQYSYKNLNDIKLLSHISIVDSTNNQ